MVPPDWLQPVLRHLCNQFIHDRARPEEITTGLRTVRELCVRMPLVMTPEMLQVSPWCGEFRGWCSSKRSITEVVWWGQGLSPIAPKGIYLV